MRTMPMGPAAASILLLAPAAVMADVTFLGGLREVSARMTGGVDDRQSAPGLGSWMGTATSLAPGPAMARLTSTQVSTVDASGITASGTLTYSRVMQDFTAGLASSRVDCFFTVDAPTAYTLDGDLREGTSGLIQIISAGGPLHSGSSLHVSGVLAPGGYEFIAVVELTAPQPGPGSAAWNLAFVVPAPVSAVVLMPGLLIPRRRRAPS
ncbi:MAG: hypothetical protein IT436_08880 [Phycisphaerales bacterium]|nr:hypothetical protein [Phycisphaerales bacterium]